MCAESIPLAQISDSIFKQQKTSVHDLAARCARGLLEISLPSNQRAQGIPGARCTRGLVCKSAQKNAHEHTGSAEEIPHYLRNGFRRISRSPRRSGFLVTVAGGVLTANLTPASRRQDHTTSPSAFVPFVNGTISVHRIPRPTSVTIAKRPSFGTGPNSNIPVS